MNVRLWCAESTKLRRLITALIVIFEGINAMTQATDHGTDRDDVTVDTDRMTPADDLLGRIDKATSAPNGDPTSTSIEAQLKLLLPGSAFIVRREHGSDSPTKSLASFLSHITGGRVELLGSSDDDEDEGCSPETVVATWTTAAGMWAVNVDYCAGTHQHEGYSVKISNVSAEQPPNEIKVKDVSTDELLALVKVVCKKGLSYV